MPASRSRASPPTPPGRPPSSGTPASRRQRRGPPPRASLGQAGVSCTNLHVSVDSATTSPAGRSGSPCPAGPACRRRARRVPREPRVHRDLDGPHRDLPVQLNSDARLFQTCRWWTWGDPDHEPADSTPCADERGASTVFIVLFTVAMLAVAGLVIDGGYALGAKREAMNSAEQAARAGADALDEAVPARRRHPGRPGPRRRRRTAPTSTRSAPTAPSRQRGRGDRDRHQPAGHHHPLRGRSRLTSRSRPPPPRSRSTRTPN